MLFLAVVLFFNTFLPNVAAWLANRWLVDDHPVPALPFLWPSDAPLETVVVELESYLEQHVSLAQAGLDLLNVVIDKTHLAELRSPENASFLVLCRNDELYSMLETVQSINDRYNHQFSHDWVFLNDEPFDEFFMIGIALAIPGGKISFGQVPKEHWGSPLWIDPGKAAAARQELLAKDVYKANSTSYRNMCRFYLGFFYKHLLLDGYDYYWRLEPGVKYSCDIGYDVFQFMRENKRDYGFTLALFEYRDTIATLWETSKKYFNQLALPQDNLVEFLQNLDGLYNLCHFWLNFEIASLAFFRSREYQAYFDHLDQAGGFFYERWGDAPIHTMAVAHLLNKSRLWWFGDIGYWHSPYLQCPRGKTFLDRKCSCNIEADFTFTDLSCVPLYLSLQGQ